MTEVTDRIEKARPQRFRPYPEYRDSGVEWLGDIPAHWEVFRLRFVVKTSVTKKEVHELDPGTEVSFVPMEAVSAYGGLDLHATKPLSEVVDGYTYFRNGDVIVAKITPCFENGKGALASRLSSDVGFGTTELHVLRPSGYVDARFLLYLTFSDHFRRIGTASMYGAGGQKRISDDFIRNFRHPVPGLSEQRAIAAFLDRETAKIDGLVARKERLIELLQEKRTALITRAVTRGLDQNAPMKDSGVKWLGEIPAHWEVKQLNHLLKARKGAIKTGPFGSQLKSSAMQAGEIKVYNQRSVLDRDFSSGDNYVSLEKFAELSAFEVYPGDLLITTRGSIGRCSILPKEAERGVLHPCLMRVQPDERWILTRFLEIQIEGCSIVLDQLRFMSNATTIDVIYSDSLRQVWLSVPPVEEQTATIAFVAREKARIDALIAKIRQAIHHLKEFRTALISAAVTGKIDVREDAS